MDFEITWVDFWKVSSEGKSSIEVPRLLIRNVEKSATED